MIKQANLRIDINSIKKENKYTYWGIALLSCTIIFIAIELKYPYFFLRDDNADSYLAQYMYGINSILEGKFPFYSFNEFGGQRFFAAGQTGIFNPLVYFAAEVSLLLLGRPDMMMDILAFLSIIIGCTGSYFLLKKLRCSDVSAVIGSIAWNYNCYNIWEGSSWMIVVYTTSVFPFFLLTSLLLLEKASVRNYVLAIIPRVYMFYLGHPQFFIFAALFDCVFIGVLCLLKANYGTKVRALFRIIVNYLFVYLSTTFLSLPLLIPEYQYTLLTYSNGSARTYENLLLEMFFDKPAFFFPFLYSADNCSFFYPPFIGYLLAGSVLIGFFSLIFIFLEKTQTKNKPIGIAMLSAIPCLAISYLLLFSRDAMKVIWYIPILNRFQYYHRISIFFAAFAVIFGCLSLTLTGAHLKKKLNPKDNVISIISGAFIIIELLTFGFLYTSTPHLGRGPLYNTNELYNYEFAAQFTGGRYICIGYPFDPATVNSTSYDLSENLNYNLAQLYNINNLSGYAGVLNYSDIINYNACFDHMIAIQGNIFEYYPGMIEEMRSHSVAWYIVYPGNKNEFVSHFKNYGIELVDETEHSVIFYDPYYEPYAYDINGNDVCIEQDVNSLLLYTDESFPGGKITLNYAYDPNYICYIDGNPTLITNEPKNWQFHVECEPGDHIIEIRYEDHTFILCCLLSVEFVVLTILGTVLKYQKNKRRFDFETTA